MSTDSSAALSEPQPLTRQDATIGILVALSVSHLLNDVMQSLIPAVYPLLSEIYSLNYGQIGWITFTFQLTASLLQPLVGMYTDRRPLPYSLVAGMGFTIIGLMLLATANSYAAILLAAGIVGIGSSVFHPEASRVARLASGGRYGLAQSLFQLGGNAGTALGPLLATAIVLPYGQKSIAWFSLVAVAAMMVLWNVGRWYQQHLSKRHKVVRHRSDIARSSLSKTQISVAIGVLVLLIFSKYFYQVSLSTFYAFYLVKRFDVSKEMAQVYLSVFQGAVAVGTIAGGPVGDRIGFKTVIWFSILGVLPFTLLLPYSSLFWTVLLTVPIGFIMASAFSAMILYAQELIPSRVGLISGIFFGFAFGMAGVGAAALGWLADRTSLEYVYQVCSYLPAIGLLTVFLPNTSKRVHLIKA